MNFINTKKANSTLQEEFFVRYKNYLVPIGVKAKNNHSKSLSTLIKSPNYKEIGFGIKIINGNIGYNANILLFHIFAHFLSKNFFYNFNSIKNQSFILTAIFKTDSRFLYFFIAKSELHH